MTKKSEIEPKDKPRLMDLVEAAGVDISDWANFKRGKKYAALNPRYCYRWAFVQPKKVVVINCWHDGLKQKKGQIIIKENLDEPISDIKSQKLSHFHYAIKLAFNENLPIRVIIQKGKSSDNYQRVCMKPSKCAAFLPGIGLALQNGPLNPLI